MVKSLLSNTFLRVKNKIGNDKDFKEIAKGGSTAFLVNLTGLLFGYLFVILVSRIYGNSTAAIYGQYIIVTLLIRIGSIITRFGTDTSMLQLTAALSTKKLWGNIIQVNKKLLMMLLLFGTGTTLLTIVFYKQCGSLFKLPGKTVLISSVFIIPMAIGLFFSQSLRGLKKIAISTFLRSSSLPILNFVLLPIFLIFVSKSSSHFNSLPVYTFFISIVLTVIIGMFYWRKSVTASQGGEVLYDETQYKTTGQLFDLSYPLLLAESMIFIGTWVDQLLLGVLGSSTDVGIFNVCIKYAMVASLSLQAVNTISAPKFSEYFFKNDYLGLARNVQKTTKMIFWTTVPVVIIYFMFPGFLLGIFGSSFTPGAWAFIILTAGALVNVITGSVGVLLQMTGHQKTVQNILIVTITIQVILDTILIPLYGVTGAAIASTTCLILSNLGMVFYVKKYFKFNSIYLFGFR
jgi:O-antigen/teichoic acid export membrane protein